MSRLRRLLSRWADVLLHRERDARLDEEVRAHLDLLTDEYVARGLSLEEARLAARRAFGGVDQVKAAYRDQRGLPWLDALMQDVRFGGRMLLRDRGFTVATAVALGLGVGVTTAIFSIVNGMNLRDLPFEDPDQIVALRTADARGRRQAASYLDYRDWRSQLRSVQELAAYAPATMNIGDEERAPDRFAGAFISANTFALLREHPVLGRTFLPHEDRAGAAAVVLLGHAPWTERYGTDGAIVGRTIRVNGEPAVVVGVMPAGFRFPVEADVWQPLGQMPGLATQARDVRTLGVVARLGEGVTLAQARAELSMLAAQLAAAHPETNANVRATLVPLNEHYYGSLWQGQPVLLMASALFVLLIACANAASLLLARSAARASEMALRATLGASRARLARQLLVESVLLAAAASLLGLGLSRVGVHLFRRATTGFGMPYWTSYPIDLHVLAFVTAVCLASGILFGLAPAWHLSRTTGHDVLKERGITMAGSRRAHRWTGRLLAADLALTLTLLAGAGLVLRSAQALYAVDQVVDATDVMTMQLTLPPRGYATDAARWNFYEALDERLSALPGISLATLAGARPFAPHGVIPRAVARAAESDVAVDELPIVPTVAIGVRYFETLGLRLLRGRPFNTLDGTPGHHVCIVNQEFADRFLPGEEVTGMRIRLADARPGAAAPAWLTVIGVSPSVRQSAGGRYDPVVYLPLRSQPQSLVALIVRTARGGAVMAGLREAVRGLDPDLPLYNATPLDRVSTNSRWPQRSTSFGLTLLGGIALLLASFGLYGVTAHGVAERTRKIGVRMAVGARPADVARLILRRALPPIAVGLSLGVIGAVGMGRLVQGLLVQIGPADPATFAGVVLLLTAVAVAACLIPTRRATRLDPAAVLRHE
jgi:putative ABC transport system permease protein